MYTTPPRAALAAILRRPFFVFYHASSFTTQQPNYTTITFFLRLNFHQKRQKFVRLRVDCSASFEDWRMSYFCAGLVTVRTAVCVKGAVRMLTMCVGLRSVGGSNDIVFWSFAFKEHSWRLFG